MEAENPAVQTATPPPAPPRPPPSRIALLREARARAEANLVLRRAELAEVDAAIAKTTDELKKLEAAETVDAVKDLLAAENAKRTLRTLREKDRPASARTVDAALSTVQATQREIARFEFKATVARINALVADIDASALKYEDETRAKIAVLSRLVAEADGFAHRADQQFDGSFNARNPGYPWLGHANLPATAPAPYRRRPGELRQFFEWMADVAFRSPRLAKRG